MSTTTHDYGLSWVDQDKLFSTIQSVFSKALGLARNPARELPPDPFTIVSQTMVGNTTFEANLTFERQRKINKTLSNAVGNMHQKILGLAENWEDLGANGGLIDLRTSREFVHPKYGKPIVAEVKNRFNTIKAVEEASVWDKIDNACKVTGGAQGYLFQITPRRPQRYDEPWVPSNRVAREHIRVCDGATAYEIVFEQPSALKELYMALPDIFADIKRENGLMLPIKMPDASRMEELYSSVYPD